MVPWKDIIIPEDRQRKILKDIDDMALSFRITGLMNPIIVRPGEKAGTYVLVAGERRLRGYELNTIQGHQGFDLIPCHLFEHLDETSAQLLELEENIKRQDLDWKEQALATRKMISAFQKKHDEWPLTKICEFTGQDYKYILRVLKVAEALVSEHPQVQQASGIKAAMAVLEREQERKTTAALDKLEEEMLGGMDDKPADVLKEAVKGTTLTAPLQPKPSDSSRPVTATIMQGNFEHWVEEYSGPKFNFIHCDFPYGLDHDESDQGGAKTWLSYEDSETTYWRLCGMLLKNRDKIMLRSCHIMFWFSMKHYVKTLEFFKQHTDDGEFVIQDFPLIWHKSDNKGIACDHTRQPRRIYETALIMSRNDRKIIKMVGNCISAPTNKASAIHQSEKPVPVLNHFFQMFCDSTTRVLDPTCGSGTSIRAADGMGAEAALGIEMDELYAQAAQKQLLNAQGLAALSEAAMKGEAKVNG